MRAQWPQTVLGVVAAQMIYVNWCRRWSQSSFVVGVYVDAGVSGLLLPEILWLPKFLLCGHWHEKPQTQENGEQKQLINLKNHKNLNNVTHSEAVNSWLLLVARPLMGLSCPRTSPRGASDSVCQRRRSPPLHPLSSTKEPGTTPRVLIQSAWALADCLRKQLYSVCRLHSANLNVWMYATWLWSQAYL